MIIMQVSERSSKYEIKVSAPSDAYKALAKYHNKRKENFLVLTLNGCNQIIALRLVSIGLVNRTIVHPREVFQWALKDNATAIIAAHNHPSGNIEPSSEDIEVTKRLKDAGAIMGIPLLDHLVFSKTSYYSFLEKGTL